MQGNMRIVLLFFFPLYLLRWWIYRLTRPDVADLRLDEANVHSDGQDAVPGKDRAAKRL